VAPSTSPLMPPILRRASNPVPSTATTAAPTNGNAHQPTAATVMAMPAAQPTAARSGVVPRP